MSKLGGSHSWDLMLCGCCLEIPNNCIFEFVFCKGTIKQARGLGFLVLMEPCHPQPLCLPESDPHQLFFLLVPEAPSGLPSLPGLLSLPPTTNECSVFSGLGTSAGRIRSSACTPQYLRVGHVAAVPALKCDTMQFLPAPR